MNVVARPTSLRAVPWTVWVLLALAALIVVRGFTQTVVQPLGTLAFAAPVLFAAAVIFVAPKDRRFVWAALFLAATPAVNLIANTLPGVWQSVAPGEWKNAVPLLIDLGSVAHDVATLLAIIGLGVLGLALGGVRSFMSVLILGFGVLVAVLNVIWVGAHPIEEFPLFELARSVAYSTLYVMGWAFVFAAALESLRSLTLIGSGLLFANVVINALLLWWSPGQGANTDFLYLVISLPSLAGWLLLIYGALRGELNAVRARSRTGRGSGARRRAG